MALHHYTELKYTLILQQINNSALMMDQQRLVG